MAKNFYQGIRVDVYADDVVLHNIHEHRNSAIRACLREVSMDYPSNNILAQNLAYLFGGALGHKYAYKLGLRRQSSCDANLSLRSEWTWLERLVYGFFSWFW